jgi:bifunctional non-homologous end joining protein LigD
MMNPILPMLATSASPFDSKDYVFEVKWDGVRALAAVEKTGWRLWGRELADYRGRYPELDVLRSLPPGTIVDGELVVFQENRPNLDAILRRISPRPVSIARATDLPSLDSRGPLDRDQCSRTGVFGWHF